ncbi:TadE/TadG family type IV pilus assembly protein [Myceligenerans pegani]|uniref:Pilus assembly protein n=1 Tax=Myceligenerans pegani TaxID=2776917 RepID=A0ABR9N1L1_9MICO|nr:TadE family protein [Myceligenerans sp. TRM 65318]MBE1877544.1 pilus assembly protein [Myceligenerans sp. TRM 65318]MBE3019815.1 pilus assembly protein [Myceligenerans sp. TRM 65318]
MSGVLRSRRAQASRSPLPRVRGSSPPFRPSRAGYPRDDTAEQGSVAINTAVIFPMVLLIAMLLVMAGRMVLAQGAVQSAANEAARSASISRTAATAEVSASQTAHSTLDNSGIACTFTRVEPVLDAFLLPLGTVGEVRVDVACDVPLADLGLPGAPGTWRMHATGTSVLDAYRGRG